MDDRSDGSLSQRAPQGPVQAAVEVLPGLQVAVGLGALRQLASRQLQVPCLRLLSWVLGWPGLARLQGLAG